MAFRQLRKVFNIDAGDYMLSVCGMVPGLCQPVVLRVCHLI